MRRLVVTLAAMSVLSGVLPSVIGAGITAAAAVSPVAGSAAEYQVLGRVFPDPQGCRDLAPGNSPFAKGTVCAHDFIQFDEMVTGMTFLEESFPKFVEFYRLDEDFDCDGNPVDDPDKGCKDAQSAGLPQTLPNEQGGAFSRDRQPLYMVRITDERVSNKNKEYFVFPLAMHGIERAGVEGGTRAAEDLATWGACEAKKAPDYVDCTSADNVAPHPILEASPKQSLMAGDVLKRAAIYFMYPNPDGWRRGDRKNGVSAYQRYNGNGVDLNRDWPEQGFTFRPYTPWSEPETRSFGHVLQAIGPHDANGNAKWTGGIDLHGQLVDRAFSFTLIGGSERPFDKNQRILQTVKGAWADAEARLAWSPIIKPNDAPVSDPRVYGVQWGTVWDTIAYTVTGALGDWIDSPIGLNADGIDNEMSFSHVSNCGTGTCFDQDAEQLHVDGNKSLIYSMINYSLKPEDTTFRTKGRVAYLFNPGVVSEKSNPLESPPQFEKLPPQKDIPPYQLDQSNSFTQEFDVKGPDEGVYNGGIEVTITCENAQGVSPCALQEARLERHKHRGHNAPGEGDWETVNTYFNQSPLYAQGGQALHANLPLPGRYRVVISGANTTDIFSETINFKSEKAWPDPGQIAYRATNMNFWKDLQPFAEPGIEKVTADELANTSGWKSRYDTIVVTNAVYPDLAKTLSDWAKSGGNVVLTDKSLHMLEDMGLVAKGSVKIRTYYAGYVNFATTDKENTYEDPLSKKINQPGAAEGGAPATGSTPPGPADEIHRRQTYEPVPLNYAIQTPEGNDANSAPVYWISAGAFGKAKGGRAVGTTGTKDQVSYGEIKLGKGRIRFHGGLLPMPNGQGDNPFGVADYGLTYAGYQMLQNLLTWIRP
jgi:hypothetical protein